MGKYDPLHRYLDAVGEPVVRLTFTQIERILGDALPPSARKYPAWWANERSGGHPYARAWLDASYETRRLDLNAQTVEFVRTGAPR